MFGQKGFDETTISDICKAAGISDATMYEYFDSKEDVLFSIPGPYTRKELERMREIARYVINPRDRMRLIIQGYLEFYENNKLYTSVALLTLKGNRKFMKSPSYEVIREASRTIVDTFNDGAKQGVFRSDIDGYIVRNMVLGFIEHLTIQWLLVNRPDGISKYTDIIYDMVMRAIENREENKWIEVRMNFKDLKIKERNRNF